jgi:hypothetical protein
VYIHKPHTHTHIHTHTHTQVVLVKDDGDDSTYTAKKFVYGDQKPADVLYPDRDPELKGTRARVHVCVCMCVCVCGWVCYLVVDFSVTHIHYTIIPHSRQHLPHSPHPLNDYTTHTTTTPHPPHPLNNYTTLSLPNFTPLTTHTLRLHHTLTTQLHPTHHTHKATPTKAKPATLRPSVVVQDLHSPANSMRKKEKKASFAKNIVIMEEDGEHFVCVCVLLCVYVSRT